MGEVPGEPEDVEVVDLPGLVVIGNHEVIGEEVKDQALFFRADLDVQDVAFTVIAEC
jgi:hypothetical protein